MPGDPTFGFFPGVCVACKQEARVGAPSVFVILKAGERPRRWTIENLRGHCEKCLDEMGIGRKGVFVRVGEMVPIIDAMEAEIGRLRSLLEENRKRLTGEGGSEL
jgi:hypothetical protein